VLGCGLIAQYTYLPHILDVHVSGVKSQASKVHEKNGYNKMKSLVMIFHVRVFTSRMSLQLLCGIATRSKQTLACRTFRRLQMRCSFYSKSVT
jgi:hypothetical protein